MALKEEVKANYKKVVQLLPKLNCGKCGYDNCGKFAKAVAEGNASPFGCRENPSAGYKISQIMGLEELPQQVDNAYVPQMAAPLGASRFGLIKTGARRRGRYGRGKRRGAGRSQGAYKGTSLWTRIKSLFGYR